MSGEKTGDTAKFGDVLYASARVALAEGLTREQYMFLVEFLWSQAASDHAHLVAARAVSDAKGT